VFWLRLPLLHRSRVPRIQSEVLRKSGFRQPFLRDLERGQKGLVIGYAAIVLSFLLVFFGGRSYPDNGSPRL
jgi:hypothetical protein